MRLFLTLFMPPLIGSGLIVLAQAADSDSALKWFGSTSGLGLLGWYLYYTMAVVFPRMSQQHSDAVALHLTTMESQRKDFIAEMATARGEARQDRASDRESMDDLKKSISGMVVSMKLKEWSDPQKKPGDSGIHQ